MQNTDQLSQLQELLEQVIHSLDLTQYDIEDPCKANQAEQLAQDYFDQMVSILNPGN